ncbi:unnamed protein product (macronuclear) [Paramecium tetraurelia]|uniref:Transmembrane protein n=1 Tax=Paramecium tetraurelia TaxID=5888 RepID=A0CY65_PARTE|nr:uncharacterized protein GSPATT00039070001 [Paramecium tetraurelia]CAK75732.1 unnamed protein product [Paramecium tetraurelia]|eukprot:XP_001443129.1 hypothetical protein (macronuclear) [Paramecium tetraurelia strain d4-2]
MQLFHLSINQCFRIFNQVLDNWNHYIEQDLRRSLFYKIKPQSSRIKIQLCQDQMQMKKEVAKEIALRNLSFILFNQSQNRGIATNSHRFNTKKIRRRILVNYIYCLIYQNMK